MYVSINAFMCTHEWLTILHIIVHRILRWPVVWSLYGEREGEKGGGGTEGERKGTERQCDE
jgi:hypothetical protein